MSVFVFTAWMHCVISNSMRLVPVYGVAMMILLLLHSYNEHVLRPARHHGYTPLTIQEIFMTLMTDSSVGSRNLGPLVVPKKPRETIEQRFAVEPMDHREFPFSERHAYPKPPIDTLLVKRSASTKKGRKDGTFVLWNNFGIALDVMMVTLTMMMMMMNTRVVSVLSLTYHRFTFV